MLTKEELHAQYWENGIDLTDTDELLFAAGDLGDYEESIYVLFKRGDQLFEVESSHCSCYGFSWEPARVTKEYILKMRINPPSGVGLDEWSSVRIALVVS